MDWKPAPDAEASSVAMVEQWCTPIRRQHSGRFDSAPLKPKGAINEEQIAANTKIAEVRRTASMLLLENASCKSFVSSLYHKNANQIVLLRQKM